MSFPLASDQSIPNGFVEVTKDEFYATVGQMDVMASLATADFSWWETPSRQVVGWNWPGWRNSGISFLTGERYAVKANLFGGAK